MNKRTVGTIFEEKSCSILKNNHYKILDRNYSNRYGEIDIIALKDNEIVFIEVKYRKTLNYGYGLESIDEKKLKKIFNLAQKYINDKKLFNFHLRFDCMSYLGEDLEWIKNIAWGDEIGL